MDIDFRRDDFDRIIERVREAGYQFTRMDESSDQPFYLRHDVDHSPVMAKRMGIWEAKQDVRANFFFMPTADAYNIYSDDVLEIMSGLVLQDHLVGLHLDETVFGREMENVGIEIKRFMYNVGIIGDHFSFHSPSDEVLGRRYGGLSAYGPKFFSEDGYASDSRRDPSFGLKLEKILYQQKQPAQLLLHPAWWCEEDSLASIAWMIVARREREVREHLLDDWEAVFRDVLPAGKRGEFNV